MKYLLIALLIIARPLHAPAQKNDLYADAGLSFARFIPGGSITYNHNLFPFMGLGLGFQGYDFHYTMVNFQFVPALYADLRFKIRPQKISQFIVFLDVGVNMYAHNTRTWRQGDVVYAVRNDNGIYTGPGIGYFLNLTPEGGGIYTTLKLLSNSYKTDAYNTVTKEKTIESWGDATLVYSIGFKF